MNRKSGMQNLYTQFVKKASGMTDAVCSARGIVLIIFLYWSLMMSKISSQNRFSVGEQTCPLPRITKVRPIGTVYSCGDVG